MNNFIGHLQKKEMLPSLYLIADRVSCGSRPLEEVLERALEGGVRFVQFREKDLEGYKLRCLAERVFRLTELYGARLILNGSLELAAELGVWGVHLPVSGPMPGVVRDQFGDQLLIGCSTHTLDELRRADREGADFVTYSPIFPPNSKPGYGPGVGFHGLRSAVQSTSLPVFALGGIVPKHVTDCRNVGASGFSLMSGIIAAEDVEAVVIECLKAWENSETV